MSVDFTKPEMAGAGRWFLGKWSRDDPQRLMNELYRALKRYNFVRLLWFAVRAMPHTVFLCVHTGVEESIVVQAQGAASGGSARRRPQAV